MLVEASLVSVDRTGVSLNILVLGAAWLTAIACTVVLAMRRNTRRARFFGFASIVLSVLMLITKHT